MLSSTYHSAILLTLVCGSAPSIGYSPQASQSRPPASASPQNNDQARVLRLKTLIEAAEKALAEGKEDTASERLEEAEAYIADWPIELLKREDVDALLLRMNAVSKVLGDDGSEDSGIKSDEEVTPLTGDVLKSEMEQVEAAEADTEFDFPIDLNDNVLVFVGAFSGRSKGVIQNSLSRGTRYFPMIHQVLAEEGLPLDLAYLPIVESGFRNEAKSRAAAVGMWQFISSTGRHYGLRIDNWVDERRDPEKATRAAARFLKHLFETNDDWYLALAGYNAGQGRVNEAVRNTESRNFWDHARSRFLRTETKNYVPQFCAAVLVGKRPDRYGLEVAQLEPYAYETVEVRRSTSLNTLARLAGLEPSVLIDLNPELVRRITPPRTYSLRVPDGKGADITAALAAIPAAERLDFRAYKIKQGDTLAKVAARYNTTPDELLAINNITRSQFRVGRNIQVPVVVRNTQSRPATAAK